MEKTFQIPKLEVSHVAPATAYKDRRGDVYSRPEHAFQTSSRLVKTGANFYDSVKDLPQGVRPTTADEDLSLQLELEKQGKDPRQAEVFDDLFGRKNNELYAFQWTLTGLRVPERVDPEYSQIESGRKYYPRKVLVGGREVGEVLVPEGGGRVVTAWNKVFGIPAETSNSPEDTKIKKHTTHFYFNNDPRVDEVSKHKDVAVARCANWHHDVHDRCLHVAASCGRWSANSSAGFRPAAGDLPKIKLENRKSDAYINNKGRRRHPGQPIYESHPPITRQGYYKNRILLKNLLRKIHLKNRVRR